MLKYKIYKPALIGCSTAMVGTLLNYFVIMNNGGKMPGFPTLSYVTHFIRPNVLSEVAGIHKLGDASTRYWYLSDYIDLGYSVLSPGDLLIHFYTFIMLYYTIKAVNLKNVETRATKEETYR
jgi:hypothetical protein